MTRERLSATLTSNVLRSVRELQGSEQTTNEVQADGCARKSETGPHRQIKAGPASPFSVNNLYR